MSSKVSIYIIEDQPQELLRTESLVFALGYMISGTADSGDDAIREIRAKTPDILLVDINLKGDKTGIDVVEDVKDMGIPVIYTTGLEDEEIYNQARSTHPAAYLVKPFNKLTFQSALENAIISLSQDSQDSKETEAKTDIWLQDCFFIKRNNLLQKVRYTDILYIMSDGNYCEVCTDKKFVIKSSLSQLLKKLPPDSFSRIHQRYVIHLDKIDAIDLQHGEVIISDIPLPIGRKFKDDIMSKLNRMT